MDSQQDSKRQLAIPGPSGEPNMAAANHWFRHLLDGLPPYLISLLRKIGFLGKSKETPDYYSVLGVSRNANQAEIKQARDRLARQHHPDRNPQQQAKSDEHIKLILEAYNVLSDPDARKYYDRYGSEAVQFRVGCANRWEAAKQRAAENATKSMHYAPLSETMACFGLEKEYQELEQTIREDGHMPGEEFSTSLNSRGYGYILRAVQAAVDKNFKCAKCKGEIVGLDGLCYCRETADIGPHCRNNKCCPNCKIGQWENITRPIGNFLNQVNEFLRG